MAFSNYFRDLLSENVHITTKMNDLNPNIIPHINAGNYGMQLYHLFVVLIIMFDVAVFWEGQRPSKLWFFCNLWPFLDDIITDDHENPTYLYIYTSLSVCLFVCLFEITNLFLFEVGASWNSVCRTSRHTERFSSEQIFEFRPKSLILAKSIIFR